MNKTNISWTDFTWNPLIGCSKISDGCKNCYAETMALRLANMWEKSKVKGTEKYTKVVSKDGWNGNIILDKDKLSAPSKRKKPARIFVGSMTDVFHENSSFKDIDEIIKVVIGNPQHTFQILTKRAKRMREYFNDRYELNGDFNREIYDKFGNGSIPNLWLGVSVENQKEADSRIPQLEATRGKVKFLSIEPQIEKINLSDFLIRYRGYTCKSTSLCRVSEIGDGYYSPMVDWVIVGGESGTKAKCREFKHQWAEKIYQDCKDSDVAFFFKQRGSKHNFDREFEFESVQEFPR